MKTSYLTKICQDSWVVNLLHRSSEAEQEPVKFLAGGSTPSDADVKMYDVEGKQIEIPQCQKCGCNMSCVIGSHTYKWICTICPPH